MPATFAVSYQHAVDDMDAQAKKEALQRLRIDRVLKEEASRASLSCMQELQAKLQDLSLSKRTQLNAAMEAVTAAMEGCAAKHLLVLDEIDRLKELMIAIRDNFELLPEAFRAVLWEYLPKKKSRLVSLIADYKMRHREAKEKWPASLNDCFCTRSMEVGLTAEQRAQNRDLAASRVVRDDFTEEEIEEDSLHATVSHSASTDSLVWTRCGGVHFYKLRSPKLSRIGQHTA